MLREIVTSNPREKVTKSKPAASERPGGQAADAVRAELEGAMERAASPGASDRASSIGSEEGGGQVSVCMPGVHSTDGKPSESSGPLTDMHKG